MDPWMRAYKGPPPRWPGKPLIYAILWIVASASAIVVAL